MLKRKSVNKLNRTYSHRKAMLRNMATSLFKNERIITTRAKAKVLRTYAEPLITLARKTKTAKIASLALHNRRRLLTFLKDELVTRKLIDDIAPRYQERNGGYLRIIHLNERKSDASKMSILELVERRKKEENIESEETLKAKPVKVKKEVVKETKEKDKEKDKDKDKDKTKEKDKKDSKSTWFSRFKKDNKPWK